MPKPTKKQIELCRNSFPKRKSKTLSPQTKQSTRAKKVYFDLSPEKGKRKPKSTQRLALAKPPPRFTTRQCRGQAKPQGKPHKSGNHCRTLAKFLTETSENACEMVEITNKERQIAFKIGENAYELTLVQKRKPKS